MGRAEGERDNAEGEKRGRGFTKTRRGGKDENDAKKGSTKRDVRMGQDKETRDKRCEEAIQGAARGKKRARMSKEYPARERKHEQNGWAKRTSWRKKAQEVGRGKRSSKKL